MDHFAFRRKALRLLTNSIGCYLLADLDNVPIYAGQSTDGIRSRVNRHLTSARSDVIANRQIDVWEVAFVWAFPTADKKSIAPLEAKIFHYYNEKSQLMNGSIPSAIEDGLGVPEPYQVIQIVDDQDLEDRKDPSVRLPRQAVHYASLVDHFLTVKNSKEIARAMQAHFTRLSTYHGELLRGKII